jgi:hypothetical protein
VARKKKVEAKKEGEAKAESAERVKALRDGFGVIREAMKILPTDHFKLDFLRALAELEDNECHRTRTFPHTRLHKVTGIKQPVYRADIDKASGWRLHLQYGSDGALHLKDIIPGQKHDDVHQIIKSKIGRYEP